MNKGKWESMTDEQKTSYMRKVFKEMNIGDSFDYTKCRKLYERMTEKGHTYGVYQNPCIILELFDPIMAPAILGWMYSNFDDNGDRAKDGKGSPAPLFGYNMIELTFDKGTLMGFSDSEKQILREAMRIIGEKTKAYMEAHKGESVDKFMAMCRGEQKPINDTNDEISEELKAASILHSELVRNQSCIDEDFIDGALWLKRQIAWSDADEEKFNRTLFYVKNPRQDVLKDTMLVEWLKSLKDRLK